MITKEQLLPYFEDYNEWTVRKILKVYPYEHFFETTKHLLPQIKEKDIKERIYIILNNIKEIPVCIYCGNPVTFWSITKGYHNYCSYTCSNFATSAKRVKTTRDRYGDKAFDSSESWYKKSDEEKAEVLVGREETNLKKFGYKCYFQTPQFKQQCIDTSQEKYGVDYPTQAPEVRAKTISTCLDVYGYENQMQSPIIQQKSKDTCLNTYGFEHASQHPDVWGKGMATFKSRYGITSNFSRPEVQLKSKNTILSRYGVPNAYHINNSDRSCHSKVSQELFWGLYNKLPIVLQNQCYFGELNKEYIIYYQEKDKLRYFFIDFCLDSKKIIIEFQGDHWHRNPEIYEPTDENIIIWEKDKDRKKKIEDQGFIVFYVWERDYYRDKEETINNLLDKILLINNEFELKNEV
jgi:very-short-patch-repair endonuclease